MSCFSYIHDYIVLKLLRYKPVLACVLARVLPGHIHARKVLRCADSCLAFRTYMILLLLCLAMLCLEHICAIWQYIVLKIREQIATCVQVWHALL